MKVGFLVLSRSPLCALRAAPPGALRLARAGAQNSRFQTSVQGLYYIPQAQGSEFFLDSTNPARKLTLDKFLTLKKASQK